MDHQTALAWYGKSKLELSFKKAMLSWGYCDDSMLQVLTSETNVIALGIAVRMVGTGHVSDVAQRLYSMYAGDKDGQIEIRRYIDGLNMRLIAEEMERTIPGYSCKTTLKTYSIKEGKLSAN